MALVDSLLSAIIRADGDALVMHVGERPYVVVGTSTINISTHGLNLEAMTGMLAQLLPADAHPQLEEFGAVEYRIPQQGDERFTVVAARGGDDIWIEIRRRRARPVAAPEPVAPPVAAVVEPAVAAQATAPEVEPIAIEAPPAPVLAAIETPEPAVAATASAPEAIVDSVPEPAWATVPEPTVEPVVEPAPAEIAAEVAQPIVELVPEPEPAPIAEPVPEAIVEPIPEPVAVAMPEPIVEPLFEPAPSEIAAEETQPIVELAPEPISAPIAEPAPEPWTAPLAPRVDEPIVEAVAEAIVEPIAAPAPEVPAEVVAQPIAESVAEPVNEPEPAPIAAPVMEPVVEAAPEPTPEPIEAPVPEPVVEPAPAQIAAEVAQPIVEPVFEPAAPQIAAAVAHPKMEPVAEPVLPAIAARVIEPVAEPEPMPIAASVAQLPDKQPAPGVVVPMMRTVRIEVPPRTATASRAASTDIERLLRIAASRGAAALFLTSESRPWIRVEGDLRQLESEAPLSRADVEGAIMQIAPESGHDAIGKGVATEWIAEFTDVGRIRCSTFADQRGPGVLLRLIATRAATVEQLGLAREIEALATESQGLVFVAGPRASGKSTLVSALVDRVNRQRAEFVITLERQIRLVHENKSALVSQREIRGGADESVAATRSALRENPDILVVDDLVSPQMIPLLVTAASEGMLVLVAMTAPSTADAVQRFIELAPPDTRPAVETAMAESFRGAVAQLLLKKTTGGVVAAREVLLATSLVTRAIHDGQLGQLPLALEAGRKYGMVSLTDALVDFVGAGTVDVREAFRKAPDRVRLLDSLKRNGVETSVVERLA